MTAVKRLLSPSTNPAGLLAAAAALWTAANMIWNVTHHTAAWNEQEAVAAFAAAAALFTRTQVTPVTDPRDGNEKPFLAPAQGLMLTRSEAVVLEKLLSDATAAEPSVSGTVPPPAAPETAVQTDTGSTT